MTGFYEFSAEVWLYPGAAAWHFITLTVEDSAEIREHSGAMARGFGSLPVRVAVGNTTWETSIFPDRKANAYLLPLKAEVRKREGIAEGDLVTVRLEVR